MNVRLEVFAREYLKETIVKLSQHNQTIFKKMYSHKDISKDILEVVDEMEVSQLDWAMQQVDRSLIKEVS